MPQASSFLVVQLIAPFPDGSMTSPFSLTSIAVTELDSAEKPNRNPSMKTIALNLNLLDGLKSYP